MIRYPVSGTVGPTSPRAAPRRPSATPTLRPRRVVPQDVGLGVAIEVARGRHLVAGVRHGRDPGLGQPRRPVHRPHPDLAPRGVVPQDVGLPLAGEVRHGRDPVAVSGTVLFGGMLATTWVQIIKAVLLLGGATLLVIMTLSRFGMNPLVLFEQAALKYSDNVLSPGGFVTNPWDALSLGLALMLGTAGLPHILMRFFTVPDAKQARKSVFVATGFIGYFYILTFIIGFGAMVLVGQDVVSSFDKGGNMAALLLAESVGGQFFLGFIAAVAFATILAVVAGLTLSGASTLSHDLYVNVVKRGKADEAGEVRVARASTLLLGVLAIVLGLTFKGQNVAFMVGLAFAIAASANFPALLMSIVWRGFTTKGAVASIVTGIGTGGDAHCSQPDRLGGHPEEQRTDLPAEESRPLLDARGIPGRLSRFPDEGRNPRRRQNSKKRNSERTSASAPNSADCIRPHITSGP